mgnify:CR=1 FL=1|jgi:hypothetical protein
MDRKRKMKFTKNLKELIKIYGLETAMQVIDVMLTQEMRTLEELNDCIVDELSYAREDS